MNKLCFFAPLRHCVERKGIFLLLLTLTASLIFAQDKILIRDKKFNEISGIAASRTIPGIYYVHNDSGGRNEIYMLNKKGKRVGILGLEHVKNRDWEDIGVGPGSEDSTSYVYVGEIGDNKAQYDNIFLYRFKEPSAENYKLISEQKDKKIIVHNRAYRSVHSTGKVNAYETMETVFVVSCDTIRICFADGAKDCETLFIDPLNGDVYLVSKRETKVGLYQIKAPLKTDSLNIATRILSLDFPLAVAGDITPARDKILIKTYADIYCWSVLPNQPISEALAKQPVKLPYKPEPQGEAICWSTNGKKYLTISEKSGKTPLFLYIYPFYP